MTIAAQDEGDEAAAVELKVPEVYYELDPLNCNPCMPLLFELLDRLFVLFEKEKIKDLTEGGCFVESIQPAVDHSVHAAESATPDMEKWMNAVLDTISRPSTHLNVRLFLVKLIVNRAYVFKAYKRVFAPHLMRLIVDEENGGSGFHYYIRDVVVTILEQWELNAADVAAFEQPSDKMLPSAVLSFLFRSVFNTNTRILRENLAIIGNIVQRWKSVLRVQRKDIFDYFDSKGEDEKNRKFVGAQLLALVVSEGLPAYDGMNDRVICSSAQFYSRVAEALRHKDTRCYSAAAEAIGLVIGTARKDIMQAPAIELEEEVSSFLQAVLDEHDHPRYVTCLRRLVQNCDAAMDKHVLRLFNILPVLVGKFLCHALEVIALRAAHIPRLFKEITPVMKGFLRHRFKRVQLKTVQILEACVRAGMSVEDVQQWYPIIAAHFSVKHPDKDCRMAAYNISKWLLSHYVELNDNEELRTAVALHLLKALDDPDPENRQHMLQFWDSAEQLPQDSIADRLENILTLMYHPDVEGSYLRYATLLFLSGTARVPSFLERLRGPLNPDVMFVEHHVDSSWQHSSLMQPLFARDGGSQEFVVGTGVRQSFGRVGYRARCAS